MSSTHDDDAPETGKHAKGRAAGGKNASGSDASDQLSSDDNQLDIEPDALLDSLLADGDDLVENAGANPSGTADDDEVTGVVHVPTDVAPPKSPAEVDEFSDVDDLLSSNPPPPSLAPTPQPAASAKRTLQGIRPAGIPRPGIPRPGPMTKPGSAPASPPPRTRPAVTGTRQPPPVNPAGPPPREPFAPAMSPKAPPARVQVLSEGLDSDDADDDPTFRAIVANADLEASRPSSYGLADELEPDEGHESEEHDFEDLDEDILESVPPEPMDSLAPEAFDSLPPDEMPSDVPGAREPSGSFEPVVPAPSSTPPPLPSSLPPPHVMESVPPDPLEGLEDYGRAQADTLLENEHTELVDSIPPDEALGTYRSERPAHEHLLDRGTLEDWQDRAQWFEREAHAMADPTAKARALLIACEHYALVGDIARARVVASEIHAIQPAMTLGSRQLRWLALTQQDYKAVAGALELETRASPTPLARAHAANLAADVQRVCFDDVSGARRKLDLAARIMPSDPRPYMLRLAEQLGTSAGPPRLRWPEVEELTPLSRVAEELERIRGTTKTAELPSSTPATALEEARRSLAGRDIEQALMAIERLSKARGMRRAALWLAAALSAHTRDTRAQSITMLRTLVAKDQSLLARQALAARAVEQGDAEGARSALFDGDALSPAFDAATRLVLGVLTAGVLASNGNDIAELANGPWRPLAVAAESTRLDAHGDPSMGAGDERQQEEVLTGQALAAVLTGNHFTVETDTVEESSPEPRLKRAIARLAEKHGTQPLTQILMLEFALREHQASAIAQILTSWPGTETGPSKPLAAALALEVTGDKSSARAQLEKALEIDPNQEAAIRALITDAPPARAAELLTSLADAKDDPAQAGFLLLEAALLRTDDAKAAEDLLVQAAASAPDLPLVYLQGEQHARQRGDAELLLNWLRQRRENATDSIDRAFDYVREALLVAESDMTLAANLLREALSARPADVALQELHERLASQSGVERGKWRETVAAEVSDDERQRLLLEASLEYERAGDLESAARVASMAEASSDSEFVKLTTERLNIAQGASAALSEKLLKAARAATDATEQRELYERLSELDELKGDRSSALLWQSAILERTPDYLPALRSLEHEYITAGRWDDLENIALELARQLDPSEADARATFVAHQRVLSGRWDAAREAIALACRHEHPSLWALRAFAAQARGTDNLESCLRVDLELMDRGGSPLDVATLCLRAAEAATRLNKLEAARALLQRAIQQVPNHLVALTTLADVLEAMGSVQDAAEALEAAATAYQTTKHQVELWHQAAVLWQEGANDEQRAVHALEAALERDITHHEAFRRLKEIYIRNRETQKLADLLERRLERTEDPDERVSIEVMRGQALAGVGEKQAARQALAAALDANPEHAEALGAYAELCMEEGDFTTAEQAWIRLARHVEDPKQQAAIYTRLGALYDQQLPNPERAERAYQEVLKRDAQNVEAMQRLVEVYVQLHDQDKAVALQERLIEQAENDHEKRDRTLHLARVYERLSQDPKQAVAILETAKKTYGHDSHVLRAHAELLQRRGEDRPLAMLLDRAANDARRALSTGRFDTAFFEILSTVSDLRGATDGAMVARSTLAALRGEPVELTGAGPRVADQRLDELLAPAALSTPLRILLQKTGHVLDSAYPVDLKALRAAPLPLDASQLQTHVAQVASAFGIENIEVFTSPALGAICMPVSSSPARLVYGQSLLDQDNAVARHFLLIRALKIIQTGAATLSRTAPIDLWPLLAGFLNIFAANWEPQGADVRKTAQATQRIKQVISGPFDNDVPVLALEVIGSIGNRASQLAVAANQFGNRAALLAVGDPSAALQGVALASGQDKGLPPLPPERLRWIVRNPEARDLAIFSVTDQYIQARQALGFGVG